MTDESLRQLLARVHERLSSTSSVDPEAREMLATVMRDIDGALAKGSAPGAAGSAGGPVSAVPVSPEARVSATAPRLEQLAVRFEADHPTIAQLLRQIGALLGQAGILFGIEAPGFCSCKRANKATGAEGRLRQVRSQNRRRELKRLFVVVMAIALGWAAV